MTAFNSRDGGFFLTTVGRVQTPTLSIVVEREEKIRKPRGARILGGARHLRGRGRRVRRQVVRSRSGRRPTTPRSDPTASGPRPTPRPSPRCRARPAGQRHGRSQAEQPVERGLALRPDAAAARGQLSASASPPRPRLSIAQALYEKHKVLTYPRTDSKALPEDYIERREGHDEDDLGRRRPPRATSRPFAPHAAKAAEGGLRQAQQEASSTTPRCRTTSPSSRRCRRRKLAELRSRPSSTTWWSSASWRCSTRRPSTW